MSSNEVSRDIHELAGRFLHRGPNTENEREAAEYIQQRMRAAAPDTMHDPFDSIDTWSLLFAAYYAEFLIVSLVAAFFPLAALVYGLLVFVAYLAEFTGYHVFARFLPQFASQNVMGRLLAERPQRLVIVTAHYDSGTACALSNPRVVPWLRTIHLGLVLLMVTILISCAVDGIVGPGSYGGAIGWVRWMAAVLLALAAASLVVINLGAEPSRGAVHNASGVAAMLELGRRLRENPPDSTEILFLATGSMSAGLNGMHHFLRHQDLDRDLTYFLNFDHVGAGDLKYTRGEGMLHVFRSSPQWLEHARRLAPQFDAEPIVLKAVPSDMLIPLARGYHAISILGTDTHGVPSFWNSAEDSPAHVDLEQVERAAAFAEALIHALDQAHESP